MLKILFIIPFIFSCSVSPVLKIDKDDMESDLLKRVEKKEEIFFDKPDRNTPAKNMTKQNSQSMNEEIKTVPGAREKEGLSIEEARARVVETSEEKSVVAIDKVMPEFLNDVQARVKKSFSLKYNVSLLGVVMGQLHRASKVLDGQEIQFLGTLQNKSLYKYLYAIDDSLESIIRLDNLYPTIVNLEKNENGSSAISVQKEINKEVVFIENALKKGIRKTKERVVKFRGHYFDPLLFLRLIEVIDIKKIQGLKIPIIFRGKLYHLKVKKITYKEKRIYGKIKKIERISFDTFRKDKLKKDQLITIEKMIGSQSKIFSLEGKMKIGLLYGELVE